MDRSVLRSLLIPFLLFAACPTCARAYDVSPGTTGNVLRLQLDDRIGMSTETTVLVSIEDAPAWILCDEPRVLGGRVVEIVIPFDVDPVGLGEQGAISLRIIGRRSAGVAFDRSHRVDITVVPVVEEIQRGFTIDECCLAAALVDEPTATPLGPRLLGSHPNPTTGLTNIVFALSGESSAQLRIFDVQGRKVREITTPRLGPGYHRVSWDTTDETGRELGAGVYFYELTAQGWTGTQKVEVLR